jgi:hypothetical protein
MYPPKFVACTICGGSSGPGRRSSSSASPGRARFGPESSSFFFSRYSLKRAASAASLESEKREVGVERGVGGGIQPKGSKTERRGSIQPDDGDGCNGLDS